MLHGAPRVASAIIMLYGLARNTRHALRRCVLLDTKLRSQHCARQLARRVATSTALPCRARDTHPSLMHGRLSARVDVLRACTGMLQQGRANNTKPCLQLTAALLRMHPAPHATLLRARVSLEAT